MAGESQFVRVHDINVHLYRAGRGEPLLWLHGAGGGDWFPLFDRLAQSFDVIAPDHPGFGKSDDAKWLEGIDDMVYFYLDFVKTLNLDGCHLAGQSMGGWVAAELAVMTPSWLKSLILVDAAGLNVPEAPIPDLFVLSQEEKGRLAQYPGRDAPARALTPEMVAEKTRNDYTFARLAWSPYLHNPKLARRLYRIDVPTLILWGEGDQIIPPRHGEEYHRLIPGSRLINVPQAGHGPQRDQPERVADAIIQHCGGESA